VKQRQHYELYATLRSHQARVGQARGIISRALAQCHAPYVACSFGKDSAVLLHLVLSVAGSADARFLAWANETCNLDTYDQVIDAWTHREAQRLRLTVVELERETLTARVARRFDALAEVQPSDAVFIGLRAEESRGRRMTLRTHGPIYRMASGMLRICPLAWWSTDDIGAYIVTHDLPMLQTYHDEGMDARTSSRVPREDYGIRARTLQALRQRAPERFNALARAFPEVQSYV
jgi:3'-phosphoadenosine 5'-phosphosulfate sulfotransferase (PAPS reductase)/FAD synthetase